MTPNIERRLRADRQLVGMLVHQACVEEWLPDAKFEIIASQLRAEPLGLCVLVPGVEYQIVHIRNASGLLEVHVRPYTNGEYYIKPKNYVAMGPSRDVFTYVLTKAYARMLSQSDVNRINSMQLKYAIVRTVHRCGPDRLHFDHKNYTWDLKLMRI